MKKKHLENLKLLREKTGMNYKDCDNSLKKFEENIELAIIELNKMALEKAQKLYKRPLKNGILAFYTHPGNQIGSLVELKCETDYVARNSKFIKLGEYLAYHITILSQGKGFLYIDENEFKYLTENTIINKINKIKFNRCEDIFYYNKCLDNPSMTIEKYILQHIIEFYENIRIVNYNIYRVGENIDNLYSKEYYNFPQNFLKKPYLDESLFLYQDKIGDRGI